MENNNSLKDFQQKTVDYVVNQFNTYNRMLVADEVGLGKTVIASGVISKMIEEKGFKNIVYICSNQNIAKQNITKLSNMLSNDAVEIFDTSNSRLSILHYELICKQDKHSSSVVNLIPLSPATSFSQFSSNGIMEERAKMFVLLVNSFDLEGEDYKNVSEALRTKNVKDSVVWNQYIEEIFKNVNSLKEHNADYFKALKKYLKNDKDCLKIIKKLKVSDDETISKEKLIYKLRIIFSKFSLNHETYGLAPDLMILDEFQRFNQLITEHNSNAEKDEKTDMDLLMDDFFMSDTPRAKFLLLSATPFKLYSTTEEINSKKDENHFKEFLSILNYLYKGVEGHEDKLKKWEDYQHNLVNYVNSSEQSDFDTSMAENILYPVMCRTERPVDIKIEEYPNNNFNRTLPLLIDNQSKKISEAITYKNIMNTINGLKVSNNFSMEFLKSVSYPLSFMNNYKLDFDLKAKGRQKFKKYSKNHLLLNRQKILNYNSLDFGSIKMNYLVKDILKINSNIYYNDILWVPASMPYYENKKPFNKCEGFTKTLIFSSWAMVPRMISTMVSYENERILMQKLYKNTDDKYLQDFSTPIVYRENKGDNSYKSLIYPSKVLIDLFKPLDYIKFFNENGEDKYKNDKLQKIRNDIKKKIEEKIRSNFTISSSINSLDQQLFYKIPFYLDLKENEKYVENWLVNSRIGKGKNNSDDKNDYTSLTKFIKEMSTITVDEIQNITIGENKLDTLVELLTDVTLGSPAVVIGRTFSQYSDYNLYPQYASLLADKFINRINRREASMVIKRLYNNSDKSFWKNLLKYNINGNLQAVFDEYNHFINASKLDKAYDEMLSGLTLNVASISVETDTSYACKRQDKDEQQSSKDINNGVINNYENDSSEKEQSSQLNVNNPLRIRMHYAVPFTKTSNSDSNVNRRDDVRTSFNSPFRPFVLTSTSVGKEGLDFHGYCRRVVHWNLPSNPIDLEQREGRINRFKCLAVRQNLAKNYKDGFEINDDFSKYKNIWDYLFDLEYEKCDDKCGLYPYWMVKNSTIPLERYVMLYPFSSDVFNYNRIKDILKIYRLTIGQVRQEDLVDNILQKNVDEITEKATLCLAPYKKS